MRFTKKALIVVLSVFLAGLLVSLTGALEAVGVDGPVEYVTMLASLLPAYLWGIILLFVAGSIAIDRFI